MKILQVCGMALLVGSTVLNCMDNNLLHPFFALPFEVRFLTIDLALEKKETSYKMSNGRTQKLHIPYTLRPINPVVYTMNGDESPASWEPEEGSQILLDQQLWLSNQYGLVTVRLEHDTENNHDTIKLRHDSDFVRSLFDGINKKRCAIFVLSAPAEQDGSYVYLLRQSSVGQGVVLQKETKEKLFSLPGFIQSAMLHPDENRIMYSFKAPLILDAIDIDTDNKKEVPQFTYGLSLIDVDDTDKKHTIAYQALDILIDKTIYLGVNRYLGLTIEGTLVHLWLDKDNKLQHSMINLTKYDNQAKKYASSDSVVKDIAVDDTCRTVDGIRPRIAYVTKKGEVFVMDFRFFKKPIPFYNTTVTNPETAFRLFYDKGELALLHRNQKGEFQDFVRWPDNLGALYLKAVLVQQKRSQQN